MPGFDRQGEIQRLEQDLDEMHALVRVIGDINQSLDLQDVLRISLEGIQRVIGAEFGCFLLVNRATRTLELAQMQDLAPELRDELQRLASDPEFLTSIHDSGPLTNSIAQLSIGIREILKRQAVQSFALIPLTSRMEPIGVLLAGRQLDQLSRPPDADLLMSIGEQVGRAIEHARLHASVRESEEWHRLFIENSLDGFVEGDFQDHITFVNDAACRILGCARAEIIHVPLSYFFEDPAEASLMAEELTRHRILRDRFVRAHRETGEGKVLSITARLVRDHLGKAIRYQAVLRDVTEHQSSLDMLHRRNHELNILNAVSDILNHPLQVSHMLDQVCEQIVSITGMEGVGLYLIDESHSALNLVAHCGLPPELLPQVQRVGLDDPITRHIAIDGESIALDDVTQYASTGLEGPRAAGYHAGIGVPIGKRGKPVGALFVGSRTRVRYEPSDVALLLNIGQRLGMALENADLYTQLQRRVEELDGLARFGAACASTLDPGEISQLAIDWTRRLLHVEAASLLLASSNRLRLQAFSLRHQDTDQVPEHCASLSVLEEHGVWPIHDIDADPAALEALGPCLRALECKSALMVPLPGREHSLGVLFGGYREPHRWLQQEIDLMQTIANQAASAIANAQLFQSVLSEQRKVQAIFDSGLSGLFATDAQGRIEMFNRAAERITGWMQRDVLGKEWQHVFPDPRGESVEPLICTALRKKQIAYVPDGRRLLTRDGREIPVAKAVAPLVDENGNVTGAVGAFWDLSREKAGELSREKFLQTAAHQMRNPLTALTVALDLLDNPRLSKERNAEMRTLIKSQAERLGKLAKDFLNIEDKVMTARPVHCESLSIAEIVRRLVHENKVTHRSHRFCLEICQPEPLAYADADRVENILHNLLDNAVNYSPEKSTVRVSVGVRPLENQVDVAVQDEGPGISFQEQEHVFDMFYRAQQTEGRRAYGHGLGLYIARKMAQEMDGTIELCSSDGHGCTFHLILRRYT